MRDHAAHKVHIGIAAEVNHHVGVHAVIAGTVGGRRGVARAAGPRLLAAFSKPLIHHGDLAFLRRDNLLGQLADLRVLAVLQRHLGHVDRALVVRDHAAHEIDVGVSSELRSHPRVHLVVHGAIRGRGRTVIGRGAGGHRVPMVTSARIGLHHFTRRDHLLLNGPQADGDHDGARNEQQAELVDSHEKLLE